MLFKYAPTREYSKLIDQKAHNIELSAIFVSQYLVNNTTMPKLLSLNTYNYRRGGSDAVFFDHDALFREACWETAVFTMQHPSTNKSLKIKPYNP